MEEDKLPVVFCVNVMSKMKSGPFEECILVTVTSPSCISDKFTPLT
jgi:hypothetical protein